MEKMACCEPRHGAQRAVRHRYRIYSSRLPPSLGNLQTVIPNHRATSSFWYRCACGTASMGKSNLRCAFVRARMWWRGPLHFCSVRTCWEWVSNLSATDFEFCYERIAVGLCGLAMKGVVLSPLPTPLPFKKHGPDWRKQLITLHSSLGWKSSMGKSWGQVIGNNNIIHKRGKLWPMGAFFNYVHTPAFSSPSDGIATSVLNTIA